MNDARPLLARFGDFQLDEANARLTRGGRPVDLAPKAFELLCALARSPGQLLTKDALLDTVWGHRHFSESVLKTTISQLRVALEDDARAPRYVETASRRGYRFIAPLEAPATAMPAGPARSPPLATAASRAQAEPHASTVPRPDLVGRGGPLAVLEECLRAAASGRGQVVFVAGEPGIGKSTLIDRFLQGLPPGSPARAIGQCVELYGAGEPYMPVLEALNSLCRGTDGGELVASMRQVAPTWLAQMPWLLPEDERRQLQLEVAGATQERMLREFGELLDRCTAGNPVLLVLEDLHWCDHATVQLVAYLARRRGHAAFMLLASFRPAEIIVSEHPLAGLRQELRLHGLCRELDLEAFSEAEVGEMAGARLGGAPAPEAFVRALHAHTEGLPLFVANVLDELLAEGLLRQEDGAWIFPDAEHMKVPASIAGVIEKQASRLPAAHQAWLGAASVAGVEFLHAPLADAMSVDADALQAMLDEDAARGHWVRGTGVAILPDGRLAARYAFRHALYRHVFYRRLGEAQRVQWHRRIAEALLAAYGPRAMEIAAELAMHHEQGREPMRAIEQLKIVSARALARSAARESRDAARHAIGLLDSPEGVPDATGAELDLRVLEGLALSRLHVISEPAVARAFERARDLCAQVSDSPARARALHGLWWVSFARGDLVAARSLAQRILGLGGGEGQAILRLAGHSATGLTLSMLGELREAKRHLESALEVYAAIGESWPAEMLVQDPGVESSAYLALVCWWTGEPARARRLSAEAVERAFALRHPVSQLVALNLAAALRCQAGEFAQGLADTERLLEVIRTHRLPDRRGAFAWLRGRAIAVGGQVKAGLEEMRLAEQSCRAVGMLIGITSHYVQYTEALREDGQAGQALEAACRGIAEAEARHEKFHLAYLLRLRGELLCERGDAAEGKASLEQACALAAGQGSLLNEMGALAALCTLPGRGTPAQRARLAELLALYADDAAPAIARLRTVPT